MWATTASPLASFESREENRTHLACLFEGENRPRRRPSYSSAPRAISFRIPALSRVFRDAQQAGGVEHPDQLFDDGEVLFRDMHPLVKGFHERRADLLPWDGGEVGIRLNEDLKRRRVN